MKQMDKYKWTAYALVVAFYVGLMAMAINRNQSTAEDECQQPETQLEDTHVQDIHTIVDWEPMLDDDKSDTVTARPSRYAGPSMEGLQGVEKPQDIAYLLRSTLFADFAKRFNAESAELERLAPVDFTSGGTLPLRNGCILSLVNDTEVKTNTALLQFAEELVRDSLYLDRNDGTNFAAVATFEYVDRNNKPLPVRLTFRKGVAEGASVWYLTEAESPFFTCGEPDKPYYVDATENEFLFIGMSEHPDRAAQSIAGPDFTPEGRTAFLALVSSGSIIYNRTIGVTYVAWLGNYTLFIEHVESWVHQRSGLLVTRLMRDNEIIFENRP